MTIDITCMILYIFFTLSLIYNSFSNPMRIQLIIHRGIIMLIPGGICHNSITRIFLIIPRLHAYIISFHIIQDFLHIYFIKCNNIIEIINYIESFFIPMKYILKYILQKPPKLLRQRLIISFYISKSVL